MKDRKKGFTLTELMVVLVIMAIVAAIATPLFLRYWRMAEFRKNESNARTVYLAAESRLTWYRSSGQWDAFKKKVEAEGIPADDVFDDPERNNRIYAITLDANTYGTESAEKNPVLELLDDSAYDKETLNGAIAIEIDVESGQVYSAFYGTRCKGLTYDASDTDHCLTMRERSYDNRKERLLGYYSVEDTVNVVNLDPVRLRIMTISLLNSEKLSLNWSSNAGSALDVSYEIAFYKSSDSAQLFSLVLSPFDMRSDGWDGKSGGSSELASLELKAADGTGRGSWSFPVTCTEGKYSLVLDAMMSAKLCAALEAGGEDLARTSSTSILRLAGVASALQNEQNIYATVKAIPYAGTGTVHTDMEYRDSEPVTSNTANTLYGDKTSGTAVQISAFRHLSNIRYRSGSQADTYTLTAKNMDWASVGTGLYDLTSVGGGIQLPAWCDNGNAVNDFPTVPELQKNAKLTGNGDKTLVSNLKLGRKSVLNDAEADAFQAGGAVKAAYLGLFGQIYGSVENVTLKDPTLELITDKENSYTGLKGIGILSGYSRGKLTGITVDAKKTETITADAGNKGTVYVDLGDSGSRAAVGGITGVIADRTAAGSGFSGLNGVIFRDLTMDGTMRVELPADKGSLSDEKAQKKINYGIGGIAGFVWLNNSVAEKSRLEDCANHADISGSVFTGGIVGRLMGTIGNGTTGSYQDRADVLDCSNDGLILSTEDAAADALTGYYFGGIVGYGYESVIHGATAASGRDSSFSYDESKKSLLKGNYVGGIIGYGDATVINNCSTRRRGYVLGAKYVGGIAGGLGSDIAESIRADENVSVTTNASYIIGLSYVGGITGRNDSGVVLKNCVNNGVAACYEKYAGGIVGYNENGAEIQDCTSYLSDYDSSVFNMIVKKWEATGDYAGGIAGYNNGSIRFSKDSEAITVKSVASIVVGGDYVGGIAGFNDVDGTLDVHYTLIGGQIYAYGNGAGGIFGLNASESVLEQELTVKPKSVEGNYCVGGLIGANIVDLSKDRTADKFRSDNSLGSITGRAFVGGIIGYQRTYTAAQLNGKAVETLMPNLQDGTHVPKETLRSANGYCLTIKGKDDAAVNNIPIAAGWYAGGVVGYCERDSYLILKDCKNTGNLSLASGVGEGDGVSLGDFVTSSEVGRSLSADAGKTRVHFVGGIIGVNLENQIIDHCTNTGNMSGSVGIGGIVGLNAGYIYDCTLSGNFGSASLSYLGGITALNIHSADGTRTYEGKTYTTGTVENCSTAKGRTISGNSDVGGIVGWNLDGGILKDNTSAANVTGRGDYVGGFAGRNSGLLQLKAAEAVSDSKTVQSSQGQGIGGIVGINEASGAIWVTGTADANGELVVIGKGVTVTGRKNAGGIAGINLGTLGDSSGPALTSSAKLVRASKGMAGGVVGTTSGNLINVVNRSELVTADEGTAGGITAVNTTGKTVSSCKNYGPVRSSNGYAGGIVADNKGTVADCTVAGTGSGANVTRTEIYSRGVDSIGAICALNSGTVKNSVPGSAVVLRGSAAIYGGVVGTNTGTVTDTTMAQMPEINSTSGNVTAGGVVGQNEGTVNHVKTEGISFADFQNYRYLGGIVGTNGLTKGGENGALVQNCVFSGTIREKSGAAGNSYGGIAGINGGRLESNSVGKLTLDVQGVYTATSTSTTAEKESLSSYAGGITGKNEQYGVIRSCTLENRADSSLTAAYGMLGGVTGFNKGAIELSGSSVTPDVMTDDVLDQSKTVRERLSLLDQKARAQGLYADQNEDWVNWTNNAQVENLTYHKSNKKVSADRMNIRMTTNGNLGGIAAYNATTGSLQKCVSGNWFLVNKSNTLGVGTGGIIGMNESEKDLGYLVNGAFVGRQLTNADTNRFAGGIIGNQNNTTTGGWTISYSVNYGTVYCYRTHYSGGIMGQWTGTGGTIENCRNYGTLQTSHQAAWVGASGGIVAQLYHAYKDNEYNIIGCGNYGSIYKKKASSDDSGANDSAGILGNITNYEMAAGQTGAPYTVQILDCFNGPGVEIYSSSMASGIFGFLSCDNVAGKANNVAVPQIRRSTETTTIRIERCRNFAYVLKGNNYYGGIFGDRYGGWSDHTIVKDNVSVNPTKDYHKENGDGRYPTYARGIGSQGGVGDIPAEDRKNNYYVDYDWGYSNIVISEEAPSGSNSAGNGYYEQDIQGKYTHNLFFMKDQTKGGRTFLASIVPRNSNGMTTVYGNSDYIDKYGNIRDGSGNKKGEVLYYVDDKTYSRSDLSRFITVDPENPVFVNARTGYYRLEGIVDNKILAPASATAKVEDGKVTMDITPAALPGSTSGEQSDPFLYRVRVTTDGQSKIYNLYTENGSFELPAEASGEVTTIEVQAVSMYEEVGESDWITANTYEISEILPEPEVRVELVPNGAAGTSGRYHGYRFKLENLEEYNRQQNGAYLYADWQVIIKVNGKTITLNRNTPEADTTMESDGGYVFQMTAQASDPKGKLTASGTISTPVALPCYRPAMTLSYMDAYNPVLTKNITVTGTTQEDMTITVELDATGQKGVDTPPVYRIEILGDWTDQDGNQTTDAVLASRNLLTVSAGKATATFTNLPEYISRAENMRVRIWYAMPGLGPVYAYTEDVPEAEANVKELTDVITETQDDGSEAETETWKYLSSTTLKNTGNYFSWNGQGQYFCTSDQLWTWLDAPELEGVNQTLEPQYGENGELKYTFRWMGSAAADYQVSLAGIDGDGREVVISSTQTISGNSWTVDGADWNYTQVRLKVTQVGGTTGTGTLRIGRASTGTYKVKPRLESPAQPGVQIVNENELIYKLSWLPIASEEGCTGYQLYIRTRDTDGNLSAATLLGTEAGIGEKTEAGTYEVTRNLEDYAGQTVVIYLVAKADVNGDYLDSLSGITNEVEIPNRLKAPNIAWAKSWEYTRDNPTRAEDFRNTDDGTNGLEITATAQDDTSMPPGGSAYLLRAHIYNSEVEAANPDATPLAIYPASYEADGTPVQMEQTADPKVYDYALADLPLKYAGKWIVFYARISSGGGNVSSAWSQAGTPFRLPYVKLDTPELNGQSTQTTEVSVNITDKPGLPDTVETWNTERNVLKWTGVDSADLYRLALKGFNTDLAGDYRIQETEEVAEDGTAQQTIVVLHRMVETDDDGNETETWIELEKKAADDGSLHFTLTGYETTVTGSYTGTNGTGNYSMDLSAELTAVRDADTESWSYELKLPDAVRVTAKDGSAVEAVRLTKKVTLQADVRDNLEEPLSEAYVESEQAEISFQQE